MLHGKKSMLARLLFGQRSMLEPVLRAQRSRRLLVLAYHRVGELPNRDYPFQHEIMSATADAFDEQMTFLKKNFNVVNFHTLADMADAGEPIPPNSVVITFDDGYADNYTTAFPILQSHGLTASIYVATGFIDAQAPFWFDMLSYYVMKMKPGILHLNRDNFRVDVTEENRSEVRRSLGQAVRVVSDASRLLILEELAQQSDVSPSPEERELARPMTWDEVRALDRAGIEIGSHTVSHPFMVQLNDNELASELTQSKQRIEQETGTTVQSLSYPTGGAQFYDDRTVRMAQTAGYRFAVSYDHASVKLPKLKPFEIPRIHVEPFVTLPDFKANLLLPRVFVR